MRTAEITVPPGQRFKNFLSETFQDSLVVVQDPTVRAKIAIALPEGSEQVRQQLSETNPSMPGGAQIAFSRLPFSLILAFCQTPDSGNRVYYRIVWPYRYVVGPAAPNGPYREIGEQFRRPIPEGASVRELSNSVKQEIYLRISKWAAEEEINLETLCIVERGHAPLPVHRQANPPSNALRRLIESQDLELRKRFHIPSDVALALMDME